MKRIFKPGNIVTLRGKWYEDTPRHLFVVTRDKHWYNNKWIKLEGINVGYNSSFNQYNSWGKDYRLATNKEIQNMLAEQLKKDLIEEFTENL